MGTKFSSKDTVCKRAHLKDKTVERERVRDDRRTERLIKRWNGRLSLSSSNRSIVSLSRLQELNLSAQRRTRLPTSSFFSLSLRSAPSRERLALGLLRSRSCNRPSLSSLVSVSNHHSAFLFLLFTSRMVTRWRQTDGLFQTDT